MVIDMNEFSRMVNKLNINIIYSGPLWEDGIKGLAEMVKVHLSHDNLPGNAAKSIFSVFVEQVTNMLMYSAEKERYTVSDEDEKDVSVGMLILGHTKNTFFFQTRNAVKNENIEYIKNKIDHVNTLDKKELRQYYKEKIRGENNNPESQGAGLGLIEIARRATAPIAYTFEQIDGSTSNFTMYVEISQSEQGGI